MIRTGYRAELLAALKRSRAVHLRVLFLFCLSTVSASAVSTKSDLPTLTQANQVRHLTAGQAALGYPVHLHGVVTYDAPAPDYVFQDASGGIYVWGSHDHAYPHHLGDKVILDGVTEAGGFAPVIREVHLSILGKAKLPTARLYSYSELIGGQLDSQWVKVQGVVRSATLDRTSWREPTLALSLAVPGGGRFVARVPIFTAHLDLNAWIGREVMLEGVCGSLFNPSRQFVGLIFYVPRLRFVTPMRSTREVSVSDLLRFSPDLPAQDRVRMEGVVAYQQTGRIFIESEGKGLRVLTQQTTPLQVGDIVQVSGFPAMGESEPILEDAIYHRLGHGNPPSPVPMEAAANIGKYDGMLVETQARLLAWRRQQDGDTLLLDKGGQIFTATLPPSNLARRESVVPLHSLVQLTGICLVRKGGIWSTPQSYRLLLRTPGDIVVAQKPSWWSLHHTLWLVGILVGALLVVFAWVVVLRSRLREQMILYRHKLHNGAVLEERNRIARELHDTLEQDLAGITLQLDLAVDSFHRAPDLAQRAVKTARDMSRHSVHQARRSVWDLRCHLLESGDLVSALKQVVVLLLQRYPIQIQVHVSGSPIRFPLPIELNLLRIGQEAMTNAVKHAKAKNILLELQYGVHQVRLSVTDDGNGFVQEDLALSGHFGLFDMQERAQALGSHLQISSSPGSGTTVALDVHAKAS